MIELSAERWMKYLYAVAGILILSDIAYYFIAHPKHHFSWEVPAFSAVYGFVMCVLLVVVSKSIGKLIMKDEDYYERIGKVR
ncbi:hypothetical protein GAH_01272 [Geoglobus ahangari]|uniref:Uncharacterized protein n=1 Tax=Geoglobus ahangari TaxID=113653 RepID=A0A0F7DBP0_9EURY|nr:hypothetical protein [Geoglobus ahangari]AKG91426.1 hypothetical protein GAH_01272 [Geoglobus ahangari]